MRDVQFVMDDAVAKLKDQGIRMTPQRYEMIRLLIELSHPTPEQLYQEFIKKYPSVSIATIYNNLKTFKELGYVQELSFGDHASRYEWANQPHDHFTCSKCGEITDMEGPDLSARVNLSAAEKQGFLIANYRLELYGVCPACRSMLQ